jgi:rhodanese-related sulfurtransferase
MTVPSVTPSQVRSMLLLREEIALLDLRHEAAFATGHPLFAANMAADRIALEAETRLPRKDVPVIVYDAGEGLVASSADRLAALGYTNVRQLGGGLQAWREAGYELFQDVNSYAKAFGELVESRRHTPSLAAEEVGALISSGANIRILDVRRFDQRPRCRTGAARRPRRAGSRDDDHRQLCGPHPVDHRNPVADQCRRHQ